MKAKNKPGLVPVSFQVYNNLGVINLDATEKAISIIRSLTADKLKAALYYLEFLSYQEEIEATKEVLADKELIDSIREADEARLKGRLHEFTPLEADR